MDRDRSGDRTRVRAARKNIGRRDLAPDPDALERGASGAGHRAIIRRVRNENIMRHVFDFLVRPPFPLWIRSL